jgi:hypothetical protein
MRKCGARCGRKGLVGCRLRSPSGSAGCVSGDGEGPVGLRCMLAVCPRGCGSRYSWTVAERASMTTMGQVAAAEVRANVMERQGRAGFWLTIVTLRLLVCVPLADPEPK